jgi:hypothetical protein
MDFKIPKFRSTHRLVLWMRNNWVHIRKDETNRARLPAEREEVFFTSKEDPTAIASNLAEYALRTGRLEEKFEQLLKVCAGATLRYLNIMKHIEEPISEDLLDSLKGKSPQLMSWAKTTGERLPTHLEDSMDDPRYCFTYSKEVLKGRLPSHLESVFFKDAYIASRYAFEVIRGFSSVRLPEELHNFMVMKSFEEPDNKYVKSYIEASENDPSKTGNITVKGS